MLKIMSGLPDSVLGVTAEGEITGSDYASVLMPAIAEKLARNKKISLLYHLGKDFAGFDMPAMVDDVKLGMKLLSSWEKIALVSDYQVVTIVAKFFGYLLPGEVRIFRDADLERAVEWLSAKSQ